MRKRLFIMGAIFIAASLTALALTDTQLRLMLLGSPQTAGIIQQGQGGFQSAAQSGLTNPGSFFAGRDASAAQTGYLKAAFYLLGELGLALTIVGVALPTKRREQEEFDTQASAQPAPWEHPSISGLASNPDEGSRQSPLKEKKDD